MRSLSVALPTTSAPQQAVLRVRFRRRCLRVFAEISSGSVRNVFTGEEPGLMGQPAYGRVVRDGHVGTVAKSVAGASLPESLMAQQNLPRVIQLPKQILLHLEVRCKPQHPPFVLSVLCEQATAKTRASISAAISTEAIEQQGITDLNALRKIYSQSMSGSSHLRAFSAFK